MMITFFTEFSTKYHQFIIFSLSLSKKFNMVVISSILKFFVPIRMAQLCSFFLLWISVYMNHTFTEQAKTCFSQFNKLANMCT